MELLPLTADDAEEFAALDAAAMQHWRLAHAMEKEAQQKGQTREQMICSWLSTALKTPDPKNVWLKVVDTATGEIFGGANYGFELEPLPKDDAPAPAPAASGGQPAPVQTGVLAAMRAEWQQLKERHFASQPYINLRVLVTHPKFQRRGAGSMLVRWGCEIADKKRVIAVLQASDSGYPLYLKHGYELIEQHGFDLRPYGVDATEIRRLMIRQPGVESNF